MSAKGDVEVMVPLKSWEDAVTESQKLESRLTVALARAERAERDLRHMHDTLTQAQRRSTECLEIARAVRAIGDDDVMQRLAPLGAAIKWRRDRAGGGGLHDLFLLLGGAVSACGEEDRDRRERRVREALLDLAAAAMCLHMGDA